MAITTVGHDPQHASAAKVKSKSGFWRRRKSRPVEPQPAPRSTFPKPEAPTQAIPAPRPYRAVQPSAAVHGTHPAHLLFELAHRALDVCADPKADHRAAFDTLVPVMEKLRKGAASEANFDKRAVVNVLAAGAQGAELFDAAKRGKDIGPQSPRGRQAIDDIVDRALRSPRPEPTEVLEKLTPQKLAEFDETRVEAVSATASADPTAVPSPVHTDGATPPVPDEAAGAATPLPQREARLTGIKARFGDDETPLDGEPCKAEQLPALVDAVGPLWMLHRGFWCPIVSALRVGEQVYVTLAGGVTDCPPVGVVVQVLHDADAERLLRGEAAEVAA